MKKIFTKLSLMLIIVHSGITASFAQITTSFETSTENTFTEGGHTFIITNHLFAELYADDARTGNYLVDNFTNIDFAPEVVGSIINTSDNFYANSIYVYPMRSNSTNYWEGDLVIRGKLNGIQKFEFIALSYASAAPNDDPGNYTYINFNTNGYNVILIDELEFEITSDNVTVAERQIDFLKIDDFTFTIAAANNAPTATAPSAPTVSEDATNVALADNIQVTDVDGDAQTVSFTITGGTLTIGTAGSITFPSGSNGSNSFSAVGTLADINAALDAATFTPTPNLFGTNAGTIAFVSNDGTVNSNNASVSFDIEAVNDEPTLTATGTNPTFTEDGSASDLYSSISISTIESGQTIIQLVFTVTNVNDGSNEIMSIDGSDVALTNGNSLTTATNGMTASVSLTATTATVTISKAGGITSALMQALVDGMTYRNTSNTPNTSNRVVTLKAIQDNGGTTNSGDDTAALSISSTITVVTVPTVSFNATSSNGLESVSSANLQVDLSAVSGLAVTVDYTVTGTATSADYTLANGTLTISAGSSNNNITIAGIVADLLDENDETVIVTLSNPVNAKLGTNTVHTYTITDDDAMPTVTFTAASQSSSNETGTMTITAQLSALSGLDIAVPFTVNASSTASAVTDYSITASPITIAAGNPSQTITITIANDALDEYDETVTVDMGNPTNATVGATTSHTATITDDDAAPTVTFSAASQSSSDETGTMTITAQLSALSGRDVTVPFTVNASSTATAITDYSITASPITIAAGNPSQIITITIASDALDEYDETVIVDMGTPTNASATGSTIHTATITDDDVTPIVTFTAASQSSTDEAGTMTITAQLSAVSGCDVTVPFAVNGSSTATGGGTDFSIITASPITIAKGSTTADITITIASDAMDQYNETVIVDMDTPTNATPGSTPSHTATITDDDNPPLVSLSATPLPIPVSISEASGISTVTATLSEISAKIVTVYLAYTGTATGGGTDYTASGSSIVINPGSTTGLVTVTAEQDILSEGNETVIVDVTTVDNGTEATPQQIIVTIVDDDLPLVTLSQSSTLFDEALGVNTITATLEYIFTLDVTITIDASALSTATGGGIDYTLSSTTILIPAGQFTGTAILTAVQDNLDEDNETVIIDIESIVNGTEDGTQQVTATITDDDSTPTVAFYSISSNGAESVNSVNLQVELSAESGLDVTVNYTVTGTATGSGTDYTLSNGTLTIAAGNTTANITIASIVDDTEEEGDETVIVTLSNPSNATLGTNTIHTYTIADNDEATSVSDISKSNISVYPNPCIDNICISNGSGDISYIIINNLSGQTVLKANYKVEKEINVKHLPSGVYLLIIVKNNSEKHIIKIVKE